MQSSITVSLSPVLSQWVEDQAAQRGFAAGEFVSELVQREHEKELSQRVNRRLTNAMETLVSGMTEGNWADVRKAGRVRVRRHD
jgi:hypothetical protein